MQQQAAQQELQQPYQQQQAVPQQVVRQQTLRQQPQQVVYQQTYYQRQPIQSDDSDARAQSELLQQYQLHLHQQQLRQPLGIQTTTQTTRQQIRYQTQMGGGGAPSANGGFALIQPAPNPQVRFQPPPTARNAGQLSPTQGYPQPYSPQGYQQPPGPPQPQPQRQALQGYTQGPASGPVKDGQGPVRQQQLTGKAKFATVRADEPTSSGMLIPRITIDVLIIVKFRLESESRNWWQKYP